jgi:hypothetical protein
MQSILLEKAEEPRSRGAEEQGRQGDWEKKLAYFCKGLAVPNPY